ncbi:MAG: hypothetical protein WCJ92_07495 [Alphaproteobacteria bacterium]
MKKILLAQVFLVICILLFLSCSNTQTPVSSSGTEQTVQSKITASASDSIKNPSIKAETAKKVDPLGLFDAFGTEINKYTQNLTIQTDYKITKNDFYKKYTFSNKTFEFMGEKENTYYSFYTSPDSDIIDHVEYEFYIDAADRNKFIKNYQSLFYTLMDYFGPSHVFEISYYDASDPQKKDIQVNMNTVCSKMADFKNGIYSIAISTPKNIVIYMVKISDENKLNNSGRRYYDVLLAYSQTASSGLTANQYDPQEDPMTNIDPRNYI